MISDKVIEVGEGTVHPTRLRVRPAKTLINLPIHAVWSESLHGTQSAGKDGTADQICGCTLRCVRSNEYVQLIFS